MSDGFTHQEPGKSVEWYTPPRIFEGLGLCFDLDAASPASGPAPWVPADTFYSPLEDGLVMPWFGKVWLNPPYGRNLDKWTEKMADYGNGVLHTYARTETRWFQDNVLRADCICFIRGRVRSFTPDGQGGFREGKAPPASHILAGFGECAEAVRDCNLGVVLGPVG